MIGPLAWALWRVWLASVTTLVEVNRAIIGSTARATVDTIVEAFGSRCDAGCAAREEACSGCSNHEDRS